MIVIESKRKKPATILKNYPDAILADVTSGAIAKESMIAVSDGAGGGGVFADLWSQYLVEHLPHEPITDYKTFDNWLDAVSTIWLCSMKNTHQKLLLQL